MEQDISLKHHQRLQSLDIWYHLPIEIKSDQCEKQVEATWRKVNDPVSMRQYTYFHPFVAHALWGPAGSLANTGIDDAKAAFRRFRRDCADAEWIAEHRKLDAKSAPQTTATQYRVLVSQLDLWVMDTSLQSAAMPGLAILSVKVNITGVRRLMVTPGADCDTDDQTIFKSLTIADALYALSYMRRVFARREKDGAPQNALNAVFNSAGVVFKMPSRDAQDQHHKTSGNPKLAPWIEKMIDPITINGTDAALFGDERAYMTSVLAVETPEGTTDHQAFRSIHDSTFFRLAEVDAGEPGYRSQKPFLDTLRDTYFYDRHAPDPDPAANSDSENTTRWITAQNHLCGIGTGDFATDTGVSTCERYYRFLQFICVFENCRLLQFSQQLTMLVAQKRKMAPSAFRAALLNIREDFLTFTHLHHFTNVSHQLQPAEMFAMLYRAMGLDRLFLAVEEELRSAADYAALQEADAAVERAQRLNNLIAIGVPGALVTGALGINVLIGERFPKFNPVRFCAAEHPLLWDMFQVTLVMAAVLTFWFACEAWKRVRAPSGDALLSKSQNLKWFLVRLIWALPLVLTISGMLLVQGPCQDAGYINDISSLPGKIMMHAVGFMLGK